MFKFFKSPARPQTETPLANPPAAQAPASGNAAIVIDTWDVFDTLIARYCHVPGLVFDMVAQRTGLAEFPVSRKQAQSELDAVGKPYTLFDIYRKMKDKGLDAALADRLLTEELAVENEQVVPIRRNLERVGRQDLLISDMYLTGEMIADLVPLAPGKGLTRPVIVGNWGKASGAIWPHLTKVYRINKHHGDNPHSDQATAAAHGIAVELVQDHLFTAWEQQVDGKGESQLALLLRECRLRSVPPNSHPVHTAVCGPLLAIMTAYSIQLYRRYSQASAIVFCSRDCDQLAKVFRAMFPAVRSMALDLNRLLTAFGTHDAYFNERIPDGAVIVDLVGSGRSTMSYLRRNPSKKLAFHSLVYVDTVLDQEEIAERNAEIQAGQFACHFPLSKFEAEVARFEVLLQVGYDKVTDISVEADSGAAIRYHEPESWGMVELEFLEFKSFAVRNLIHGIKHRPIDAILRSEKGDEILEAALEGIFRNENILNYPSTYHKRDGDYFQSLVAMGNKLAQGR